MSNFPISDRIKLIRHQESNVDIDSLIRSGHFNEYQSIQKSNIYNCDSIISFAGVGSSHAVLVGHYKVVDLNESGSHTWAPGYIYSDSPVGQYRYELEHLSTLADFEHRLVIDWGASTRAWHQWLTSKEVVEIRAKGRSNPFPGYLDFVISIAELRQIIDHPEANKDWVMPLSHVAGVYLIVDSNGRQYVGSASGANGLLGRWSQYAKDGHGGNKGLIEIKANDGDLESLQFSILEILPLTLSRNETLQREEFWKQKLGTRAHGLNQN